MMSDKLKDKYIKIDSMDFGDINIKVELEDFDSKNVDHYDMSVEKKVHKYKDFKIKNAFEIKETDHDFKDIDMKEDFDPNVINIKGGDNRHYIFIKEVNINEQMNLLEHEDEQTKFEPLVESFESIVDSHPSTSQLESCHINRIEDSNMCLENLVSRSKKSDSQNSLQSSSEASQLNFSSLDKTLKRKKLFECIECKFSTFRKDNFVRHKRLHTGERPFQCAFCDYRSLDKSTLKNHIRIHTGEKPFKCTYCDYRTSHDSNLRNHIKTHTGEKPFKCNDCNYSASRKSFLRIHYKIHSGEKPFECDHCKYSTSRKSHLKRHFKIHTGEKPFKCEFCEYSGTEKSHLKYHMKRHN